MHNHWLISGNTFYGNDVGLYGVAMHFALVDRLQCVDGWDVTCKVSTCCDDVELIVLTLYRCNDYISVLQRTDGTENGLKYYYIHHIRFDSDCGSCDTYYNACSAVIHNECRDFDGCADTIIGDVGCIIRNLT